MPSEPASHLPINQILVGDCMTEMAKLPADSIDVIFADPPYNLQLQGELERPDHSSVDGVDDEWDQFESQTAYDEFTHNWMRQARRVLKPDGSFWVIGSYHNIFRVGRILQDLGFWILNDVIWRKTNPMPNFRGTRFTNAHETLLWAAKSQDASPRFNYRSMKSLNGGKQMRSDWTLPICIGRERLCDENGDKIHPTQKPESLLHRVILSTSGADDVILDPFFGTGTTGAVAKKLGRQFIGIEANARYAEAAYDRIGQISFETDKTIISTPCKRKQKRIPFGALVENGMIQPGTRLSDGNGKYIARVRADGKLIADNDAQRLPHKGSIHQVGAAVQGAKSCNGWTFWHMDYNGDQVPIDILREEIRAGFRQLEDG